MCSAHVNSKYLTYMVNEHKLCNIVYASCVSLELFGRETEGMGMNKRRSPTAYGERYLCRMQKVQKKRCAQLDPTPW
jgi:hypothetical protein